MKRRARALSLALLLLGVAAPTPPAAEEPAPKPDIVVLLHGLGRSPKSMRKLAESLSSEGFQTVSFGYPSRKATVEELGDLLGAEVEACCADPGRRVHFVTHSLGGIVLRQYLAGHVPANLGRVVMISPPNHGSEMADLLPKVPLAGVIAGPAAEDLGTGSGAAPTRLGPVGFELGVIAGSRSYNPVFSSVIPGKDDGMVSVESAKVEGMKDFILLPHSHTFILKCPETARQTALFLEQGRFDEEGSRSVHP